MQNIHWRYNLFRIDDVVKIQICFIIDGIPKEKRGSLDVAMIADASDSFELIKHYLYGPPHEELLYGIRTAT